MIDRESLRSMIRDVIETEIARLREPNGAKAMDDASHAVRIESDADLAAFARQVLSLAGDESARERIQAAPIPSGSAAVNRRPRRPKSPGCLDSGFTRPRSPGWRRASGF
jgi:hypothetical protein